MLPDGLEQAADWIDFGIDIEDAESEINRHPKEWVVVRVTVHAEDSVSDCGKDTMNLYYLICHECLRKHYFF